MQDIFISQHSGCQLDGDNILFRPRTGQLLILGDEYWRVVEIRVKQGKRYAYCTVPTCTPEK